MTRFLLLMTAAVIAAPAAARGAADRVERLNEVVVTARRPLREIGARITPFDSVALRENISLSMADVLAYNSAVFVKSYGRATLSTVAFRGTSPSHTQVTWNGMRINSPMLGMTDFSTIPAFFIDKASLVHGSSSVAETGGGLGGLVRLSTKPDLPRGVALQYVQGVGSFSTFDEFLRFSYSSGRWSVSTRAACSTSPNDYTYVNRDKKVNIYDDTHTSIIGQYHPRERNRSGAFRDINLLQEVFFNPLTAGRFGLSVWLADSRRELPMLTTDYGDERQFDNTQREKSLRAVLSWKLTRRAVTASARAGYAHTALAYDYSREVADGRWAHMTRSRSRVNTFFATADAEFNPSPRWSFSAGASLHQHLVRSADKNVILQDGDRAVVGYDKGRAEMSLSASARWQPIERVGMSVVVRQDFFGSKDAATIPAFFADALLSRRANVMVRASVSRNYRFPSLNDLYFLPGGNPDLLPESGFTYDAGLSFSTARTGVFTLGGSASWFDSRISDWIIWLPTTKGFFSPRNVKKVHAYGVELKSDLTLQPFRGWVLDLSGSYSWTPSVNRGEKMSPSDRSVGRQLPYVPRHSASVTGRLAWRTWGFMYKWCYYSERYTMSSNDQTLTGHLPPYFMSNVTLEKSFSFRPLDLQLKLAVNNLFNEHYLSVLSRPMPGINFEFFISITPRLPRK